MIQLKTRKPSWLKMATPGGPEYTRVRGVLNQCGLSTVCQEARCPNLGECWGKGTATVMILGDICTRDCRFCAVTSGHPRAVDETEPQRVARAAVELGLKYVVLTMVHRDDLDDGGASHVASTVRELRRADPTIASEVLVGDFGGDKRSIDQVLAGEPDVFAHNVEVVRRLTSTVRDARCDYDLSLRVLGYAKDRSPRSITKSSLMVGVGETDEEVDEWLYDVRGARVDAVTLGQYLRPSARHLPVDRYVSPEQFQRYRRVAESMGHRFVVSGPMVRSSYGAAEVFAGIG
ncbi:MAG: lipoyl synthase [Polyangiaceae bacterium]|nr:lipoyl synthase [Polyangiaceae bacterium]